MVAEHVLAYFLCVFLPWQLNMFLHNFCRLQEKEIRRITSELKPSLTVENEKARVIYSLGHIEPSSLEDDPTFIGGFNIVHTDEKWFYRTRKTQNMYLSHREEAPRRECKHKNQDRKSVV